MGKCQYDSGFRTLSNPFGTIYNPYSLRLNLEAVVHADSIEIPDILNQNERFYWWQAHHLISENSEVSLKGRIKAKAILHKDFLKSSDYICITPGTSFVYRLKDTGRIVGNCHKVPGTHFTKELLSVFECRDELQKCVSLVRQLNPDIHIIFTVSPVRHLRDGFTGNSRSKARLMDAVMDLESDTISYFPAYELLLDDLRDYRFYADDLIHPNDLAVTYIYQKFFKLYFDEEAQVYSKQFINVEKLLNHKPFSDSVVSYKSLMETANLRIRDMAINFPGSDAERLLDFIRE
jgi:hypothetical protein